MPRCLTCARIVEGENVRCDVCAHQAAADSGKPTTAAASACDAVVAELDSAAAAAPSSRAAGECPSSAPEVPPVPPAPPGAPRWRRWYLVGGLSVSAGSAAITIALLGAGGAADRERAPAIDQASLGPAMSREAPSLVPGPVKWTDANSAKWVSNHKRSVAFELPAENTASAWLTRVRPTLVVRCLSSTTDAFVFTQLAPVIEPGDDTRTVRLQFDGEDEHKARWTSAADHDALFAPDPIAFARRLARARTLRFGFTPHNGPPATIVFDVRGFDARVGSIARTCRWK